MTNRICQNPWREPKFIHSYYPAVKNELDSFTCLLTESVVCCLEAYLPFYTNTCRECGRTQHQYIDNSSVESDSHLCVCIYILTRVCVYVYLMCRRPDGVNNGKITVHDIRARIFHIQKKLHNNTVTHQYIVTVTFVLNIMLHQNSVVHIHDGRIHTQ